jgi:hypothetical protein
MATSQACCHLPSKMLNSAAKCADRARIERENGEQKRTHELKERERGRERERERLLLLWGVGKNKLILFDLFPFLTIPVCAHICISNNICYTGFKDLALKISSSKLICWSTIKFNTVPCRERERDVVGRTPRVEIMAKSTIIRNLEDRLQVSEKLCKSTFSTFQQYLRQFSFNIAPLTFSRRAFLIISTLFILFLLVLS